jgi:hypothetical protein
MKKKWLIIPLLTIFWLIFSKSVFSAPTATPTPLVVQPLPTLAGVTPPVKNCEYVAPTDSPEYMNCYTCIVDKNSSWTVFGCVPANAQDFVTIILKLALGAGGGIAFLAMLFGGYVLLTSAGSFERIIEGKRILTYSAIGLLVIVFSVFILRLIGIEILGLPDFGK